MSHKLITEFIGTFFLVLIIGLSSLAGSMAPVAIGIGLACLVYMGGHVSGAQYNPAVSLAVLLRGKMTAAEFLPYIVVQFVAATFASLMVFATTKSFMPGFGVGIDWKQALAAETLFTFMLALVVLHVATTRATANNSYYGIAIGGTVMAAAFVAGPISGGAFNPAVGLGPALATLFHGNGFPAHVWVYVLGPCVGAALAAYAFRAQMGSNAD